MNIFTNTAQTAADIADRKIFAGPRVKRLRSVMGLTQSRMAQDLGLSVSYLNLLERNQRPLTAAVLLKLADTYDVDIRQFTSVDTDRRSDDVLAALLKSGTQIGRSDVREFTEQFPEIASAFLRLAEGAPSNTQQTVLTTPLEQVRRHLLDRGNHFPELDAHAESLAEQFRQDGQPLDAAVRDRLRQKHGLTVRVMPLDVMPNTLRRYDLHSRQILLSEVLDSSSRTLHLCAQLAWLEVRELIDAEQQTATNISHLDETASKLLGQNLANYWAAALMMPYTRFHTAAETLGYDLEILQARFSVSFEQVAHRLSTLQRPGARGIPFMLLRSDRAGQISKRFSAGRFPFASEGGNCPIWILSATFAQPGKLLTQVAEVAGGEKIFTVARTVAPQVSAWGVDRPRFAIALSCSLEHARALTYTSGIDLQTVSPVGIGPSCPACTRENCRQRSAPPIGAKLKVDRTLRGATPYDFSTVLGDTQE